MKLSGPQKRVLKFMERHNCGIEVYVWGNGWLISPSYWHPGYTLRPRRTTLEAVERRGLLVRIPEKPKLHFEYRLTPKDREIAKELENEVE